MLFTAVSCVIDFLSETGAVVVSNLLVVWIATVLFFKESEVFITIGISFIIFKLSNGIISTGYSLSSCPG